MKAILFDFDGTLADTLPLSFHAFQTVFKQYDNRDVTIDELISMLGPTEEDIIGGNFSDQTSVQQAIEDYYSIYEKGHLDTFQNDQNIIDLLHDLKENGIKLGVITGKSRRAYTLSTEALSLHSYFDIAITGNDVEKPKPDPEGINNALSTLGINKSNAIFIGDSNADIVAGKAAGVRTYGVQWLSTSQSLVYDLNPDAIFTSVVELRELLDKEGVQHGN
ncbi:HAD family hydrolase [Paenibacillus sp. GSMTC-2017]|nr:HAD family hydrolase [Paenibacillus sp. GSMTC-2017]